MSVQASELFHACVYTTRLQHLLEAASRDGQPFWENKRWATASKLFEEARRSGKRLPLICSDASHTRTLIGWALIDDIALEKTGTHVTISGWTRLTAPIVPELLLLNTGEPIAEGFIRPYALCQTPWFIPERPVSDPVTSKPRAWLTRVAAFDSAGAVATPMKLDARDIRNVSDMAEGDFVFLVARNRTARVVGLGHITATDKNTPDSPTCTLTPGTGSLAHPVTLLADDLTARQREKLLANSGSLAFSMTWDHAYDLALRVHDDNPSCGPVLEERLLGLGALEAPNEGISDDDDGVAIDPDDMLRVDGFEGRVRFATHLRRERSVRLRNLAVERYRARSGGLACEACGFDFADKYGALGHGFAEVHHAEPLGHRHDDGAPTRLERLKILCANCHRMVHRMLLEQAKPGPAPDAPPWFVEWLQST